MLICYRAKNTIVERSQLLNALSVRLQASQEARDNGTAERNYQADADNYFNMLMDAEANHDQTLLELTRLKDVVENLERKLADYDSAVHELDQVLALRARVQDLEGHLDRSQEKVSSYQVCNVLNYNLQIFN